MKLVRTHLFRLGGRDVGHPAVGFVRRDKAPQSFCDDYGAAESRALIKGLTDEVWASTVPTGLRTIDWVPFPTLKRGANKHCAYGAVEVRAPGLKPTNLFLCDSGA